MVTMKQVPGSTHQVPGARFSGVGQKDFIDFMEFNRYYRPKKGRLPIENTGDPGINTFVGSGAGACAL